MSLKINPFLKSLQLTKQIIFISLLLFVYIATKAQTIPSAAPLGPIVDEYYGVKLEDPYRNLENLKDSTIFSWYKSQGSFARSALDSISGREALLDKMKELYKRNPFSISSLEYYGDRLFFLKRSLDDQFHKLYYKNDDGIEVLLFDPEKHNPELKKKYNIDYFAPSWNGKKVVIGISESGSEQSVIHVIDADSKIFLKEKIDRCWITSPSWLPDNSGFFYTRQNTNDPHSSDFLLHTKAMLHILGEDPDTQDKEIFSSATHPSSGIKPEDFPMIYCDRNNSQVIFAMLSGVAAPSIFIASINDLTKSKVDWKKIIDLSDGVRNLYLINDDLYIHTHKDAPNFKIVKTKITDPDIKSAQVIVPESDMVIKQMDFNKNGLYYIASRGMSEELYRVPLKNKEIAGKPIKLSLPVKGSYSLVTRDIDHGNLMIRVASWVKPVMYFDYSADKNEFKQSTIIPLPKYPEFDDLIVKEVDIVSHDGVKVPLTIIYKKDIKLDGNNPLLLYAYGAYGFSQFPEFNSSNLVFCLKSGIYAIAHVRGGGEKGDSWHKDGYKKTKPNTWKDFIACAEYLIKNKYTSPQKLIGKGTSAGGILIGRAITERPELFAVAIVNVGFMNAVRMEIAPNGPNNTKEFGSTSTEEGFRALYEMDAYHHIVKGEKYPATLVVGGLNDPRVIVWQPGKFAARLQTASSSTKPIIFKFEYEGGHGIGNAVEKRFYALADEMTFALWQTGHSEFVKRGTSPKKLAK